jgi:hypothetical protein
MRPDHYEATQAQRLSGFIFVPLSLCGQFRLAMCPYEDPAAIAPDLPSGRLRDALRTIYPPEKEALGVIALEIARESPNSE